MTFKVQVNVCDETTDAERMESLEMLDLHEGFYIGRNDLGYTAEFDDELDADFFCRDLNNLSIIIETMTAERI